MIDKNPLVTVYIPTYNRLRLLKRAVNSVLTQTYTNIELIIVDDESDDGTASYLENLEKKHPNLRYLKKKEGKGAPASRNLAIRMATGQYITGLDDDDYFYPERITELFSHYHPEYSFVFSRKFSVKDIFFSPIVFATRKVHLCQLLHFNIVGNQIFTETYKLREIGGFDENLPAAQDYDTWIRLIQGFGSSRLFYSNNCFVDTDHQFARITSGRNNRHAAYKLLNKKYHKKLTKSQKKSFKARILITKNKNQKIFPLLLLTNPSNCRIILGFIKQKAWKKMNIQYQYCKNHQ
ncbi:glycosyltransferase [Salicola sp. Rm-C-2C1-2]|uniref:glycosyltransferase n=1 Tax=Salicola sp. Rm-C-2C1-2 TaxID=3141321 RepID=UPI0032E41D02